MFLPLTKAEQRCISSLGNREKTKVKSKAKKLAKQLGRSERERQGQDLADALKKALRGRGKKFRAKREVDYR